MPTLLSDSFQLSFGFLFLGLSVLINFILYKKYQKKTRENLDQKKRLKAILDHTVDGLITINPKGLIETFNRGAEKLFGYQEQEVQGRNIKLLMPEPHKTQHDTYLKTYRQTRVKNIIGKGREVQGLRKDGTLFTFELSVSELVVEGRPLYSGIVRDLSAQRHVETSLIDANNFQNLVMDNIPDLVFVKDHNFRIIQANPAFLNVHPVDMQDKVIGSTTLEKYNAREAEKFLATDKKALEDGICEAEETIQFPDGETRILLTKKVRFHNDAGEAFILGIARDITDLKTVQKKIVEAEHTKKAYADATNDGYWDWLIQADYQYMSPRFWEMFGYSAQEKTHHPQEWQDIIFPEDLQATLDNFNKHVTTKGAHPFDQEVRYRHKNGSTVHVLCKGKVVKWDEDGKPLRMIGTHTDITVLKQAQETLKSTAKILEDSLNEIYLFDAETLAFLMTNRGARHNLGYTSQELQNLTPVDIKPDLSEENFRHKVAPLLTGEKETLFFETRHQRKDGTFYDVEVHLQLMPYLDKNVFVAIILDITSRKAAERKIMRSNQDLDDFAYIASHDLKEPLRGIYNHANALKEDFCHQLDDIGRHKLERIITLSEGMESLISTLLSYARLGRSPQSKTPTDLNKVVDEVWHLLGDQENVTLRVQTPLPTLLCDRIQVTELFRNLITNALKYNTSDKKEIMIDLDPQESRKKGTPVISVKDNGIGIDPKFHQDIFKIFKRLHKKDAYGGGSGAGLTFVKKIVDRHGGEIWLESELNKGTTFFLTLPNAPEKLNLST